MKTILRKDLRTHEITTNPVRNNPFEIEIMNDFTTSLSTEPLHTSRLNALTRILNSNEHQLEQETIVNLGKLKQTYLPCDTSTLSSEPLSVVSVSQHDNFTTDFTRFADYLVTHMTNIDFEMFISLLEKYELFTLLTLTPNIILYIGVNSFLENYKNYFTTGKFLELLKSLKNYTLFNIISKIIPTIKVCTVASVIIGSTILIIPKLFTVKHDTNIRPIIKADRIGGETSKMFDKVSTILHKLGSEFGLISSSFPSGFMLGSWEKFSTVLNNVLGYKK